MKWRTGRNVRYMRKGINTFTYPRDDGVQEGTHRNLGKRKQKNEKKNSRGCGVSFDFVTREEKFIT